MGISFLGNTPDFKTWFFNIDGKTFVANNSSTVSPLKIMFTKGRFYGTFRPNQIIPGVILVKNHSFDIITGTSESKGVDYIGIVEWTWAGQKYRSAWKLFEGDVIREGIPEEGDPGIYSYDLYIIPPYVIYNGPTGGPVGTGIVIPPASGSTAPSSGSTAPSSGSTAPSGGGSTTPSGGGSTTPSSGGSTTSSGGLLTPFVVTTTGAGTSATAVAAIPPTAVASTDWVKLALQAGAAYLLMS